MNKKNILYPLWALIVVFIVMFICGLNWWRVTGDALSLLGTVICIAASVGVVICVCMAIIISKYMESVNEEFLRLNKKIEERK